MISHICLHSIATPADILRLTPPSLSKCAQNLAQGIYDRFLKQLDNKEIALLDYACGPGLVSYKLLEEGQVKKIGKPQPNWSLRRIEETYGIL